jgi:hypothetical protein
MTPQIRNMFLVGAQHVVPVLLWRADESSDFRSSLLRIFVPPSAHFVKFGTRFRKSDLECGSPAAAFPTTRTTLCLEGSLSGVNTQETPAFPRAQALRAQCPPAKHIHPAGGCTHYGKE